MRSVYDIQKDIAKAQHLLSNLILEKKLTMQLMDGRAAQAKEIAERAIAKMKEPND